MAITINPPTALHTHFFGPLLTLFPKLKTFRSCPKVSDADWLQLGICRALASAAPWKTSRADAISFKLPGKLLWIVFEEHLEFRADAVGSGDDDWMLVLNQIIGGREQAEGIRELSMFLRGTNERGDVADERRRLMGVDPRRFVSQFLGPGTHAVQRYGTTTQGQSAKAAERFSPTDCTE